MFVYLCGSCKHICADSSSETFGDTYAILVERTHCVEGEEVIFSTSGADKGASFYPLSCKNCSKVLGKRYISCSEMMSHYRDHHALQRDSIEPYELSHSSLEMKKDVPASNMLHNQIESMAVDLYKVNRITLSLHERLEKLEQTNGITYTE